MELPILLAIDTTENWKNSDTVLGVSELAVEIAGEREDGSIIKYLLIGDGKPAGPDAERLRATPEFIAALPAELRSLAEGIAAEERRARAEEEKIRHEIQIAASLWQTMRLELEPDGERKVFPLPGNFVFSMLSIVEINGIGQKPGADYILDAETAEIRLAEAPETGDTAAVYYTAKIGEE